jgi:hypothetical protein
MACVGTGAFRTIYFYTFGQGGGTDNDEQLFVFKSSTECTEIAALYNCSQINLQFYAEMPSDGYSVLFCCC